MKWWILVVVALLIGFGIGVAYQKSQPTPHSPIHIVVGTLSQEPVLNPWPGDVITWRAKNNSGIAPKWLGPSPCEHDSGNTCQISAAANNKTYAYVCPPQQACDPEVPVGSDVSGNVLGGGATRTLPEKQIFLYCDTPNGSSDLNVKTNPDPAPVSKAAQGAVYWSRITPVTTWSVDNNSWKDGSGNPVTVCKEAVDEGQVTCTLVDNLPTGNYTYKITAGACTTTPTGTFTLQVNP